MRSIRYAFWGLLILLTVLWAVSEPRILRWDTFSAARAAMVQYSGVLAICAMSVAMVLALRARWPERWFDGLDKMYRLHKWLGIGFLVIALAHWLWAKAPKWAVGLGLAQRPARGLRRAAQGGIEQALAGLRGSAESLGEWAFYAAVILIALALIRRFPYRWFYKTHRLLAAVYLVLVFHTIVLLESAYWTTPIGMVVAVLLACGTVSAAIVLMRKVGARRRARGRVAATRYYPGVRVLEIEIEVPEGWPGHEAGQFAFVTSDTAEGAHPYTIASAWHEADRRITLIVKELGDHTAGLKDKLRAGDEIMIEGPYGRFTFADERPRQIWVGAGIGITPFIARMKAVAEARKRDDRGAAPAMDLFHPTADYDPEAERKLRADAEAAGVNLHFTVDARDGRLSAQTIRAMVPEWKTASLWFCGPVRLGDVLKKDFAAQGFPVGRHFHQELFTMR